MHASSADPDGAVYDHGAASEARATSCTVADRGFDLGDADRAAFDRALLRARELFLADATDEREEEIETLIPGLVDAGYVEVDDQQGTWGLTQRGRERADSLEAAG